MAANGFQELVANECGGVNPLMRATSHFTQDKTHLSKRPYRPQLQPQDYRESPEDEMVREFMGEVNSSVSARLTSRPPQSFHMGLLLEEMRIMEKESSRATVQTGPNVAALAADWAHQYNYSHVDHTNDGVWVDEYLLGANSMATRSSPDSLNLKDMEEQWDRAHAMLPVHRPQYAQEFDRPAPEILEERTKHLTEEAGLLDKTWDEVADDTRATADEWVNELLGDRNSSLITSDEWTSQFMGLSNVADSTNKDASADALWSRLEETWSSVLDNTSDATLASDQEYTLTENNPHADHKDPWEAALVARQNGDFPTAVLLLEEAARQSPEKAQIWLTLGLTLAQNEQDPKAIQAFKKCLSLMDCPVELQLEAYMALAVSLTNEAYQVQAVEALREWLARNPKYSHLAPPLPSDIHLKVTSLLSGVEEAFLAAARLAPVQDIDADVQTGLGVLLHLAGDYEKAADCFRAALSTRPQDAQLWNRLGATLANGGHSEEAVEAYRQALELCPGFIRSRYNVAVACINLGAHEQACEHLVAALSSQQQAQAAFPSISPPRSGYGSGMSDNLWSSLRTALAMSGRHDLLTDTERRDLRRLVAAFGNGAPSHGDDY